MKGLSLLLSIIVGIASILVFRNHLLETATAIYDSLVVLGRNTDNATNSNSNSKAPETPAEVLVETPAAPAPATNMSVPRAIRKVFLAAEQAEGAGARVRRSIGTPQLRNFSPFLMLDHFSIKPGAGFPDHPHRGQEVSLLLLLSNPSPPPSLSP